jgi:pseudouridine-5'-phosphate glycosidase
MEHRIPPHFEIPPSIQQALSDNAPIVALESTVITHGLPFPDNIQLAMEMESEVRRGGAVPATIAVLDGKVYIGLENRQLERIARGDAMQKISARDFGPAIAHNLSGGTTVAGTLLAARSVGIRVFATGGIGGVHREPPDDISADLLLLAQSPLIVVCAGAKAILDLDATVEYLETHSIPVVGFQTNEFPAFYSISSSLKTSACVASPEEAAAIANAHWAIGMQSAVLLVVPPPETSALSREQVEEAVVIALAEADQIRGQAVTPFLLKRVNELTGGRSLQANLDLLTNNARVAAQVARHLRNLH